MKRHSALKATLASLLLLGTTGLIHAQEVKIGINLPYTGIGAEFAQQIDRGMEQYLKLNPDAVKPYSLKLIKRDVKNPGGADAKIVVQELLTQEKVDALGGWVYSPNAIASAPIVAAGKKLAVIMNAGTAFITNLAPEYVRTSFSMWHAGYALGEAAAKIMKVKTAVVGYSDFPPG
jgi:branched-chain amino acid transport system substrate-binding protein